MKSVSELRAEIDIVDGELANLLVRRQNLAIAMGEAKRHEGTNVLVPGREAAVLDHVSSVAGPNFAEDVRRVYATIFEVSKSRQSSLLEGSKS